MKKNNGKSLALLSYSSCSSRNYGKMENLIMSW